jgi:transposase
MLIPFGNKHHQAFGQMRLVGKISHTKLPELYNGETLLDLIAQVYSGKGSKIKDVFTGEEFSTWFFVMTLTWSRHQHAEIVTDQKVTTWLGCYRRAFEFFGGVVHKVIIDDPKCEVTKACFRDPVVQRADGDCAESYGFITSPCTPADPKKKGRIEFEVKYIKRNLCR